MQTEKCWECNTTENVIVCHMCNRFVCKRHLVYIGGAETSKSETGERKRQGGASAKCYNWDSRYKQQVANENVLLEKQKR